MVDHEAGGVAERVRPGPQVHAAEDEQVEIAGGGQCRGERGECERLRYQYTSWRSITPQPSRSGPATGNSPLNAPNGCS